MDKQVRWDVKKYQYNNPLDQNDSKNLLIDISKTLDDLDIDYWLVFGTALGAYRDNKFISWDTDIDVGMFLSDRTKLIASIGVLGLADILYVRDLGDIVTCIRYNIPIDIYLFKKTKKSYKSRQYSIPRRQIDKGFSEINFCGRTFKLVKDPDKYLTRLYGDWKTSKKGKDKHANE